MIMPKPGGGMFFWTVGMGNGSGYGFGPQGQNSGGDIASSESAATTQPRSTASSWSSSPATARPFGEFVIRLLELLVCSLCGSS
jgi:hypothetical protein